MDDHAIEMLASALLVEPEDSIVPMGRYLRGERRATTLGAPPTMGAFTELICYLLHHSSGTPIQRVLSFEKGTLRDRQRFPVPDFLIEEGGIVGLLECKATEAIDFTDLLEARRWRRSYVCRSARQAAFSAIEQLGYDGKLRRVAYDHKLRAAGGSLVPFPSSFGRAFSTAWVDGRWRLQETRARAVAPEPCTNLGLSCQSCISFGGGHGYGLSLIAHNSPGMIAALDGGRTAPEFLRLYRQLFRAVWVRNSNAFRRAAAGIVTHLTESEYSSEDPGIRTAVVDFFSRYFEGL
ncbi:MAG: hypothetical protein ABL893_06630, partial [Hyphomicrobium sp.]